MDGGMDLLNDGAAGADFDDKFAMEH